MVPPLLFPMAPTCHLTTPCWQQQPGLSTRVLPLRPFLMALHRSMVNPWWSTRIEPNYKACTPSFWRSTTSVLYTRLPWVVSSSAAIIKAWFTISNSTHPTSPVLLSMLILSEQSLLLIKPVQFAYSSNTLQATKTISSNLKTFCYWPNSMFKPTSWPNRPCTPWDWLAHPLC